VIHARYLHSKAVPNKDIPATDSDGNHHPSIVDEHSHSNTPAASGSSVPSISSPPDQSVLPEYDDNNQLPELSCSFCEGTFSRHCDLNDHINPKQKRRYKCIINDCSRAFSLRTDLTRHVKTHQTSAAQERFLCDVPDCQKSFTRHDNLLKHRKKHSG
jgi:uncharacterized Zn-finger protein